ncbi:hypothetical protein OG381_34560 [Streptomyces sp. NBC_00490]|uniref:hypothetical protein n=1 Tax=Streptomyces sp. NBC_00490 TaxID=2903657 RepID=UPI002E191426
MSQREVTGLTKILSDPENESRSAEEIAQLCIDELDALRSASDRLAVVGQLRFGPQEDVQTVVLGPFRAPLLLRDEERFADVVRRPCTQARDAGQHLAWDSKTGTGSGRFMLAPAFMKPRDAWDFYRPEKRPDIEHITKSIARWRPGLWAEEFNA